VSFIKRGILFPPSLLTHVCSTEVGVSNCDSQPRGSSQTLKLSGKQEEVFQFSRQGFFESGYRGDITHKGDAYPGEHKAIVDKVLWEKVQAVLAQNRVDRATGADAKYPSLLAGLAFDESGERLTPTHAVKKGTRYRYYVSKSLITGAAKDHSQGRRIPAGNLEALVIGRLRDFLADEGAVLSAITDAEQNGAQQKRLIARGRQISEELPTLAPDVVRSILMTLVNRVDI